MSTELKSLKGQFHSQKTNEMENTEMSLTRFSGGKEGMKLQLTMRQQDDSILSKMVEAHNTDLERFKYIDYEIIWQTPSVLGTVEDFLKINSELSETIA